MALELVEASKYSNDILQVGVIEKLVWQDPILERLQFKNISGNGLTYNVEAQMSGAGFYAPGDVWVESTSTVDQQTAVTTILGGDADVDNFLRATRSDINDLMGEQLNAKIKAVRRLFMRMFWYGYTTIDTKGFQGMHYLVRSTIATTYPNVVAVASNNATPVALSLAKLEEAVDMVKEGKPDLIVMTKQCRRNINKYLRTAGGITHADMGNRRVQTLFEIPVAVSDYISDSENVNLQYGTLYGHDYTEGIGLATDESATTIFVLQFAPEACCGLQSGGGLTTEKFEKLETKDASRVRIKWYPSLMLQNILTCSKVTGVKNDTATA